MSRISLLALLIAAGVVFAQAPADENPATIDGTVTNALTGEPLLRAHVTLRGMAAASRRNIAALTDAEGKFSATVPAGSYTVTADRVGFTHTADRLGRLGISAMVRAGDRTEVKLKLNPNGAITGRVVDENGEPVEGVNVFVEGGTTRGIPLTASTDEKGQFRLGGLEAGRYRVKARPISQSVPPEIRTDGTAEVQYAQTYYPNSITAKGAARVSVGIGAEVGGVTIQLVRTPIVRVSGTVTGAPRNERVMIEAMTLNAGARQSGVMREDGTFQVWRLDPGKYVISAFVVKDGQMLRSAPVDVEIAGSNIDGVELRMFPLMDIGGQVEYEDEQAAQGPQQPAGQAAQQGPERKPPPRILNLRESNGRSFASARIGPDGSFKIENLSPGRYRVTPWNGVYVRSMRLGQVNIDSNLLDLSGGANGAALTILLSSAVGEISGAVTDDKGPVAQIPVTAISADAEAILFSGTAMTADDGSYRLSGLAPGRYKILATEDNFWARAQADDMEDAEVIEVNRGDKLTRDLKLKPQDGN
jgi:hypothetical protein